MFIILKYLYGFYLKIVISSSTSFCRIFSKLWFTNVSRSHKQNVARKQKLFIHALVVIFHANSYSLVIVLSLTETNMLFQSVM